MMHSFPFGYFHKFAQELNEIALCVRFWARVDNSCTTSDIYGCTDCHSLESELSLFSRLLCGTCTSDYTLIVTMIYTV